MRIATPAPQKIHKFDRYTISADYPEPSLNAPHRVPPSVKKALNDSHLINCKDVKVRF